MKLDALGMIMPFQSSVHVRMCLNFWIFSNYLPTLWVDSNIDLSLSILSGFSDYIVTPCISFGLRDYEINNQHLVIQKCVKIIFCTSKYVFLEHQCVGQIGCIRGNNADFVYGWSIRTLQNVSKTLFSNSSAAP